MRSLDELRAIAAAATPGHRVVGWPIGCGVNDGTVDDWTPPRDIPPGRCTACRDKPEPCKTLAITKPGARTRHLEIMPDDGRHSACTTAGRPLAGNYDYEEGGIIAPADTAQFVAFTREVCLALCDLAKAARVEHERCSAEACDVCRLLAAIDLERGGQP